MGKLGKRARQRRIKELSLGVIILTFVIALIIGITVYMFSRPKGLDPQSMCPADGPIGHYVLLIDTTDSLNFTQKQAFERLLHEIIEKRIPEGYLISVFIINEDFQSASKPVIELCNPGKGDGKSELTSNLKKLRQQYEDKFVEPLFMIFETIMVPGSAKTSPIFEMLQFAGINAFRKYDVKGERRLIIFSDMLHNTPQFSMYKGNIDFSSFIATDYGRKTQLDLKNVDVEIHYIMNTPHLQTKRNLFFWEEYFNKAGARIVDVLPLEG